MSEKVRWNYYFILLKLIKLILNKFQTTNKFWKSFQNFLGNTIPQFIVNVLTAAGYDSALSIADLNESDILIIQDYVTNKAQHLIKEHVSYTQNDKFEFLPGHKKLVLGLRNKVKDFNTPVSRQTQKNPTKSIQPEEDQQISEEIELLTEVELAAFKTDLISKLSTVSKSVGAPTFTEHHLVGSIDPYISKNSKAITSKIPAYKCFVKCVICEKRVPCTFNKRWETSNLSTHLKSHQIELSTQKELEDILNR